MTSIGNDIVALHAVDASRTRRSNFYSRIVTPAEKDHYNHTDFQELAFEHFVWLTWSIKESVYKCRKRHFPLLTFMPHHFAVMNLRQEPDLTGPFSGIHLPGPGSGPVVAYTGLVQLEQAFFYASSVVSNDYIASIVTDSSLSPCLLSGAVRRIQHTDPSSQSIAIRQHASEHLRQWFPEDHLAFGKGAGGEPILLRNTHPAPLLLSFSHHHDLVFHALAANKKAARFLVTAPFL